MPSYTIEQVKAHCKPDDVWIILHNKVYDVTKYLEDHPGGSAVLIEVAGSDATETFEEIGHSDEAREQLEPYYVGDLPEQEHADSVEVYRPTFEQVSQSAVVQVKTNTSGWSSALYGSVKLGLGVIVGAGAIVAHRRGFRLSHLSLQPKLATSFLAESTHAASTHFWSGVGIASVAQLALTLGLGMWASTKLDVQQEFTHYAPRRATSSARLIRLNPKSGTKIQTPKPKTTLQILSPREWRPFILTSKTEVAPNVYHLVFALPDKESTLGLPTGQHIALRATINGSPVSRSYTPISNDTDIGRIELLIKTYPNGLMTQHLAQMPLGSSIDIRGPKGAMKYSAQYARRIGMIAGGTGITPMYQLIRAICEDGSDETQVSLLYANNTEADILLRKELEGLAEKFPAKFRLRYVLSRPDDGWTGDRGFVTSDLIQEYIGPVAAEDKVLLCGPPPMVGAMKKALEGLGWTMPGAVAKATDQVFLF
ncbi:hypothetical protein BDV18DRAFT_165452 [Aspergillus unguis]